MDVYAATGDATHAGVYVVMCCGSRLTRRSVPPPYMPGADGFILLSYEGEAQSVTVNGTLYVLKDEFYADAHDANELLKIDGVTDG